MSKRLSSLILLSTLLTSCILSLIFVILRNLRFFVHNGFPDAIEMFGYNLKAFILIFPIAYVVSIIVHYVIKIFISLNRTKKSILILLILVLALSLFAELKYNYASFRKSYNMYIYTPLSTKLPPVVTVQPNDNYTYVIFTFDTEEDTVPGKYKLNSYEYIDNGVLEYIAKELYLHNISATFYVTPNVARDRPDALKMLEKYGHEIGLHIHVHTLKNDTVYPYILRDKHGNVVHFDDFIEFYNYSTQKKFMLIGKKRIEKVLGHKIYFYRSGCYSCSLDTERAARDVGFRAIANHRGIYYIEPVGIWNLGRVDINLNTDNVTYLIQQFEEKRKSQKIINIFNHPMYYYNCTSKKVEKRKLKAFVEFLDYLGSLHDIKKINSTTLLMLLQKSPSSLSN